MSTIRNFLTFARNYAGPKELLRRSAETLLGYIVYPIAYLFPRNDKKWVFGTNVGFTDNAKYLYLYTMQQGDVHPIWITNKRKVLQQMRELQLEAYAKWSLRGLWHCLTAGRYIFTAYSNDINFFTVGRAKKVELWHGVGIKSSVSGTKGAKKDEALRSALYKIAAPHTREHFDLFLSTGPLMNEHFTKMFRLRPGTLFEGSYPRCNFLRQPLEAIERHVAHHEPQDVRDMVDRLKQYKTVYIYMPTWRSDMKDDFLQQADIDFERLNQVMKRNRSLFLFKLHPAVRHHADYSNLDAVRFLDPDMDVYAILPFTHVLITDYSSIYYDYLLMPEKKVLLFPFDYQNYTETSKVFAFDFDTHAPGKRAYTFEDLIRMIDNNEDLSFPEREQILQLFWGTDYREKADTRLLYDKIKKL